MVYLHAKKIVEPQYGFMAGQGSRRYAPHTPDPVNVQMKSDRKPACNVLRLSKQNSGELKSEPKVTECPVSLKRNGSHEEAVENDLASDASVVKPNSKVFIKNGHNGNENGPEILKITHE